MRKGFFGLGIILDIIIVLLLFILIAKAIEFFTSIEILPF